MEEPSEVPDGEVFDSAKLDLEATADDWQYWIGRLKILRKKQFESNQEYSENWSKELEYMIPTSTLINLEKKAEQKFRKYLWIYPFLETEWPDSKDSFDRLDPKSATGFTDHLIFHYTEIEKTLRRSAKIAEGKLSQTLNVKLGSTSIPSDATIDQKRTQSWNLVTKKIFLASSSELREDRREFQLFIGQKNNDWIEKGIFLRPVVWEDFLDALSPSRLQDEYNKEIRTCEIFVMLFWTKVGMYTEQEFESAVGQFKNAGKPFVFTYFKNAPINTGDLKQDDVVTLHKFQQKLKALGHFQTVYKNTEDLKFQFNRQLDKLYENDFERLTISSG